MTNADKFKNIFGLYATELWSMPEKDFLKWLNSEVMNCSEIPNNSPTISRQSAIDALDKRFDGVPMELTTEILELRRDLRERIPSAQPEIIYCKDCKQFRRWVNTDICFCSNTETEVSANDFCSKAERIENNGRA